MEHLTFSISNLFSRQDPRRLIGRRTPPTIIMQSMAIVLLFLHPIPTMGFHPLSYLGNMLSTPTSKSWHRMAVYPRDESLSQPSPRTKRPRSVALGLHPYLSIIPVPASKAALALVVASSIGLLTDRFLSNVGILMTLAVSATLSNLGLVPSSHRLYDVCWSYFLPASLALLLLSLKTPVEATLSNDDIAATIRSVSIPFAIGSIGSVLGCMVSFWLCRWKPNLWLPPHDAAVAAGCLCASYIGGSVNFFHTANILGSSDGSGSSLLGSMAAADLIVMAIYFAFLATAAKFRSLIAIFEESPSSGTSQKESKVQDEHSSNAATSGPLRAPLVRSGTAFMLISTLAFLIVVVSNRIEAALSHVVPGTGCAVIALLASTLPNVIPSSNLLWMEMQRIGTHLSSFCFHLLFSAIGTSANIGEALQTGPACLVFSLVALLIHIVFTFVGSVLARPWNSGMRLEDVLVASNAAIGGPATAAAFAGTLKGPRLRGLTMAATVWGVFGYAIATGIGVGLTRVLQGCL